MSGPVGMQNFYMSQQEENTWKLDAKREILDNSESASDGEGARQLNNDEVHEIYSKLFLPVLNAENLEKAWGEWKIMQREGVKPDIVTENAVRQLFTKIITQNEEIKNGPALIQDIENVALTDSIATCNIMLQCYAKNGLKREMQKLLDTMEREHVTFNKQTYDILMVSSRDEGNIDRLKVLVVQMMMAGFNPDPNVACFI